MVSEHTLNEKKKCKKKKLVQKIKYISNPMSLPDTTMASLGPHVSKPMLLLSETAHTSVLAAKILQTQRSESAPVSLISTKTQMTQIYEAAEWKVEDSDWSITKCVI